MIKNYLKIFLKTAGRNKLFTSLSLFGISLTIMFIMIFSMAVAKIADGSGPEADLKKIIFSGYTKVVEKPRGGERGNVSTANCGQVLCEQYLKKVAGAEVISMFLGASSWEFIQNGQLQVRYQKQTDAEFWDVFHYDFLQGRPYTREEVMNRANLAVITRSLKQLLFGDEENVLGRSVQYNSLNLIVTGVVEDPPVTTQNARGDLYFPYTILNNEIYDPYLGSFTVAFRAGSRREFRIIRNEVQGIIARLNAADTAYSSISLAGPYTQLEKMMASRTDPDDYSRAGKILRFLMIGLAFILLPAVNLMAINFSRIHERFEEIAVRKSFGASSSVLRGQFLFENIMMTLSGGVIGILLSYIMVALLGNSLLRLKILGGSLPLTFSFNIAVFAGALAGCFLFGILSGYLPAARLSRMKPSVYLKGGEI